MATAITSSEVTMGASPLQAISRRFAGGPLLSPPFEGLAGGLVSTAGDYLTFLTALHEDRRLPPHLKAEMTSDQLTAEQRVGTTEQVGPATSWGWQIGVDVDVSHPWTAVGRYGWTGGSGTGAYVDTGRDLIGVVFTQRFMSGPRETFSYFWRPLAGCVPAPSTGAGRSSGLSSRVPVGCDGRGVIRPPELTKDHERRSP